MKKSTRRLAGLVAFAAVAGPPVHAQQRNGARDFDWEVGTWTTTLRCLTNPLSPEPDRWVDFRGTTRVTPAMDGQTNLVELDVASATGSIRGVSLRLYDPRSHQWSLNFASVRDGHLTAPVRGGFDASGRGLFYGQEEVDGRVVLVRFVITPAGRDRVRFVQSYSPDAGATWEDNWIATDVRR